MTPFQRKFGQDSKKDLMLPHDPFAQFTYLTIFVNIWKAVLKDIFVLTYEPSVSQSYLSALGYPRKKRSLKNAQAINVIQKAAECRWNDKESDSLVIRRGGVAAASGRAPDGFVIAAALTQTSNCGILSLRLPLVLHIHIYVTLSSRESCTGRFICICGWRKGCRRCKSKKQQRANINRLSTSPSLRSGAHQECPESMRAGTLFMRLKIAFCVSNIKAGPRQLLDSEFFAKRWFFFQAPPLFLIKLCNAKASSSSIFSSRSVKPYFFISRVT